MSKPSSRWPPNGGLHENTFSASLAISEADSPGQVDLSAVPVRPPASVAAMARRRALDRLKDRLQGQKAPAQPLQAYKPLASRPAPTQAPAQAPLLLSYPAQVPQFKPLNPPPPTQQRQEPAPQDIGAVSAAHPPSSPPASALDEFVRRAEALRQSLAEATGPLPSASPPSGLDLLRFISEPSVANDLVHDALRRPPPPPQRAGRVGPLEAEGWGQQGPPRRAGDDASEGYDKDYESDRSDSGTGDRSGKGEETDYGDEEDEDEAAAWSEQQLLGQLFFPGGASHREGSSEPAVLKGEGPEGAAENGRRGSSSQPSLAKSPAPAVSPEVTPAEGEGGPLLQVLLHGIRLPSRYKDLSFVVKSPALSALSQRQHRTMATPPAPLSSSAPEEVEALPIASWSLPAHVTGVPLPCPLVLEVWDQRVILVGVLQMDLLDAGGGEVSVGEGQWMGPGGNRRVLHAVGGGHVPLRNPLLDPEEEGKLLAECSVAMEADLTYPYRRGEGQASTEGAGTPRPGEAGNVADGGPIAAAQQTEPRVQHTFRVTVCGGRGLPDVEVLSGLGRPVPCARFMRYLYPGEEGRGEVLPLPRRTPQNRGALS